MIGWQSALAVVVGGGIGSLIRYIVTFVMSQRLGPGFPWWTFLINVTGSFLIGLIFELTQTRAFSGQQFVRLFLMTGVLGGYTTFSTFSLDTWQLAEEGVYSLAFAYSFGSVVAGFAGALGGIALVRVFSTPH